MTRVQEKNPDLGEMPAYKSPANRLVHSLRKGYDNIRGKLKKARDDIKYYQIRTRDLEKSREHYKNETNEMKKIIKKLEQENEHLKNQSACTEIKKKQK